MKIAVLTMATGKYVPLLKELIRSIDSHLFKDFKKDIFIFSDSVDFESKNNLFIKEIKYEDWPNITLKRYERFSELNELENYDLVLYMDSDLIIMKDINEMPDTKLFGVCHPANLIDKSFWPVETDKRSKAFLDIHKTGFYYQGCLWGGSGHEVLKMCKSLCENIKADLKMGIIAIWYDESHLNKYFNSIDFPVETLPSSFCYPENWSIPVSRIIIHKDKNMTDYPRFPSK